jgi:hypothetical protein
VFFGKRWAVAVVAVIAILGGVSLPVLLVLGAAVPPLARRFIDFDSLTELFVACLVLLGLWAILYVPPLVSAYRNWGDLD